jgi:hypothetical protein
VRGVAGEEALIGADIEDDITRSNGDPGDVVFTGIPGPGEHVKRSNSTAATNLRAAIANFHDVAGMAKAALEKDFQGIREVVETLEGAG